MTSLTSNPKLVEFILNEANGQRSRDNVVVTQTGTEVVSGTLLTQIGDTGAGSAVATAGNTGNPTFGSFTVGALAKPGAYNLTFTAATKFDVEDPAGVRIGSGTTGVAFSKAGLGFTLTAGGTPAVAGDSFTITVAAGNGKYGVYTANGAAGPASAILYSHLPAATGDVDAVAFSRDCEVVRSRLTGLDSAGESDLKALGVVVRGTAGLLSTAN